MGWVLPRGRWHLGGPRAPKSSGTQPIDAGPLTAARLLESLAWLNISLNQQPGWTWKTGWKLVGAPEARAA